MSAAAKARIHSAHAGSSIDTNLNEPMGLAHGHSAVTPAGGWAQQRRQQAKGGNPSFIKTQSKIQTRE